MKYIYIDVDGLKKVKNVSANEIVVDTSAFAGVLSATDTDLQTALNTLDSHSHSIEGLIDVNISTIADGQVLKYDSVNGVWVNSDIGTGLDADTLDGLDSSQFLRSDIDATAAGKITISSGKLVLGGTNRTTPGTGIELSGVTSSAILSVQDGNGRIQLKWNATTGTAETFLVGAENAGFWEFNPATTTEIFSVKFADGSSAVAGDAITWTELFKVGTTSILFKGNNLLYASDATNVVYITQADFDALGAYDSNIYYMIPL